MSSLKPSAVKFIKLGYGGEWEAQCLSSGTLRFGYHETPDDLCVRGDWEAVRELWIGLRNGNGGTATRDTDQIRAFYTTGPDSVFITFSGGYLYWCQPVGQVEVLDDGSRLRRTLCGWHNRSLAGVPLTMDRLSGHLLKVQGFRGTICNVDARDYLVRKINDEPLPEVSAAIAAEAAHKLAIVDLCRLLTWQDFELLVDLLFSTSGWRRTGAVGRTQKTVDLELELPTTGEKAFVQVKSDATVASLSEYVEQFGSSAAYARMFFVWHTGALPEHTAIEGVTLLGPTRLAQLILDSGLSRWLREKVS
ncbi:conserved hypothetical protein [Paraburkholderia piptadeniae]|uniref:Restriction endonuclease type IV Mrr domain-containing protein n=1 Tax=Paraburkholderia piptadeniae TaxID=1701573 RepID=A0A1N7SPB1_9BURK|nr:conserved hypothetical protein [Paraburkholderia piptadeniae]